MSKDNTAVATVDEKEIALVEDAIAKRAEELRKKLSTGSSNKISLKDKIFTLPDGRQFDKLDVIVLGWNTRQSFYEGNYDPKNVALPACYAIGDDPNNMAPAADLENKVAENCNDCPHNQWGSGGGNTKACKTTRYVIVRLPGSPTLYSMFIPPASLKLFDDAMNSMITTYGDPVRGIATISFNQQLSYGQVIWSGSQPNPEFVDDFKIQQTDQINKILTQKPE